jgi:hypothetical protein
MLKYTYNIKTCHILQFIKYICKNVKIGLFSSSMAIHFSFSFQLIFIKHSLDTEAPHPSKMMKPSPLINQYSSFTQNIFNSFEYLHSCDKGCSTQPICGGAVG